MKYDQYVREIRPEDLPMLVEICQEHATFEKATFEPAGKEELFAELLFGESPPLHGFLLFGSSDQLLGYMTFSLETSTWSGRFLHVDCLYVKATARGRRGSLHLIGASAAKAMRIGGTGLVAQWQTPVWNERAIGYYQSLGAQRADKARFSIDPEKIKALADRYVKNQSAAFPRVA